MYVYKQTHALSCTQMYLHTYMHMIICMYTYI